jgi:putative transposase
MMEMMDKYYLDHPTAGVLTMVNMLILAGMTVGAKRVRRLMRKIMAISRFDLPEALEPYKIPNLLRHLGIDHPNQVWSTDISYIPMKGGFMYLYAIIDVYQPFHRRLETKQYAIGQQLL